MTSKRMEDALDETVERMLKVLVRWGEDKRGPSVGWTRGIADTVEVLVRCRVSLEAEVARLRELVAAQDDLLVAYRLGVNGAKAADRVRAARAALGEDS